jgi:hypothetical protein
MESEYITGSVAFRQSGISIFYLELHCNFAQSKNLLYVFATHLAGRKYQVNSRSLNFEQTDHGVGEPHVRGTAWTIGMRIGYEYRTDNV